MPFLKLMNFIPALLLVASLSGCFKSDKPLFTVAEAEFPFQSITYEFEGENDQVTLVRTGNAYTAPQEQGESKLLLKRVSKNLYVVQVEYIEDHKAGYLYGVAQVSDDQASAQLLAPYALREDRAIARKGEFGLRLCADDKDMICLSSLQKYIDYALSKQDEEKKIIRILSLK